MLHTKCNQNWIINEDFKILRGGWDGGKKIKNFKLKIDLEKN